MNVNERNCHILLHRPTPWQSDIHCSTKIYAKLFKRSGYRVSYLESPMDIGHLVKWQGYYHVWRQAPRWENGVWIMNPFTMIPVRDHAFLRSQAAIAKSYRWCIPNLPKLMAKSGQGEPDIIWTTRPGSSVLKDIFPNAKLFFQVVDYYPAFRGEYIKAIEKTDYMRADHIFLIGQSMVPYLTDELCVPESKITVLGQGVALDQYKRELAEPDDLESIPGARAIWVGVLNKGDRDLFSAAAEYLDDCGGSLVLIGPGAEWANELQSKRNNVYLLGSKSHEQIPAYLKHSDVGLMLYDRECQNVYFGQNPLKLYEYAAAGLPIISTPHREFQSLEPPVIEVSTPEDVFGALRSALSERDKWSKASLEFAAQNSWDSCFECAEEIIQSQLNF